MWAKIPAWLFWSRQSGRAKAPFHDGKRYFPAFFPWRAVASREGCFARARRSVFLRHALRFLTLSLPWLCPIIPNTLPLTSNLKHQIRLWTDSPWRTSKILRCCRSSWVKNSSTTWHSDRFRANAATIPTRLRSAGRGTSAWRTHKGSQRAADREQSYGAVRTEVFRSTNAATIPTRKKPMIWMSM